MKTAATLHGVPDDTAADSVIVPPLESRVRRENALWLVMMEKRVIMPIKWLLLALTLMYWFFTQDLPGMPAPLVFGIFAFYFMANVGHTWLSAVSGIGEGQARSFSLGSLAVDVVFLVGLVYADARGDHPGISKDFYIFFPLLVLRGLAILRGPVDNLIFGLLLTLALIGAVRPTHGAFVGERLWPFAFQLALVWIVFSIGWFLIDAIRGQQRQISAMSSHLSRRENLALLGEVSAGVAHEINNPIAIIGACTDYLLGALPEEGELREEVATIRTEANRCKAIVQDLLDFAAPDQSAEIREVDLRALCDDLLAARVQHDWRPAPEIVRRYTPDVLMVRGDARRLAQAIANILANAHHFMGGVGLLSIVVSSSETGEAPVTSVEISDSGPGIPREALPHIFKPFFSKRKGGTGLGLAITRRIIEAHGGAIEARTRHGATFVIRLPAIQKRAGEYEPASLTAGSVRAGAGGAGPGAAEEAGDGATGRVSSGAIPTVRPPAATSSATSSAAGRPAGG